MAARKAATARPEEKEAGGVAAKDAGAEALQTLQDPREHAWRSQCGRSGSAGLGVLPPKGYQTMPFWTPNVTCSMKTYAILSGTLHAQWGTI